MEDENYMRQALAEALLAKEKGEVPVGAVVVKDGRIIGRGHNQKESAKDPIAHAEILALRQASQNLVGWRLAGTTIYSTLEPCPMCAGALVQARVQRLVYAAPDPKAGAAGSIYNLVSDGRLNHRLEVKMGVLRQESEALLKEFFGELRSEMD